MVWNYYPNENCHRIHCIDIFYLNLIYTVFNFLKVFSLVIANIFGSKLNNRTRILSLLATNAIFMRSIMRIKKYPRVIVNDYQENENVQQILSDLAQN